MYEDCGDRLQRKRKIYAEQGAERSLPAPPALSGFGSFPSGVGGTGGGRSKTDRQTFFGTEKLGDRRKLSGTLWKEKAAGSGYRHFFEVQPSLLPVPYPETVSEK